MSAETIKRFSDPAYASGLIRISDLESDLDTLIAKAEALVELILRGHCGGRSHGQVGKQRVQPPRHGGRFVMVGQPK